MNHKKEPLLVEANKINYRLRSTFFLRKIREYNTSKVISLLKSIVPMAKSYNWDERATWGIKEESFEYINHSDIAPIEVFCHPRIIREFPLLIAYYRNVAALSQKSISYLANINVKKYELEDKETSRPVSVSTEIALKLTYLFNWHISLVIESSVESFNKTDLNAMYLTSTGAQIDGSWRNAIGEEAERVFQRLLVKEAIDRKILDAFINYETKIEKFESSKVKEQIENIHNYRGIMLSNQTSILFSSEPDISLIGKDGISRCVIEVKGGADPAGALERYGASKKSFEESLRENPRVKTVLVASCITPEVNNRIKKDKTIHHYFNLTEIIGNETARSKALFLLFDILK